LLLARFGPPLRGVLGAAPLAGRLRPPVGAPGCPAPGAPWAAGLAVFLRRWLVFWPALALWPSGWPLARPPLIKRPGANGSSPPARPPEARPRRFTRAPFWPF